MMTLMPRPNPNWQPGDKIKSPVDEMIRVDPEEIGVAERYKLLIGSIVPRPIAFVSTIDSQGQGNLAPFSFYNGVSSSPPCVVFSVSRKPDGSKKDTLLNIEQTKQFVINSANMWLAEPLVQCGANYPHGVDEMQLSGLTAVAAERVKPARVKESAISMECELYQLVEIGDGSPGSACLVIGRIILFHVAKQVYQLGKIDLSQLQPLSRLGGFAYGETSVAFELKVPGGAG